MAFSINLDIQEVVELKSLLSKITNGRKIFSKSEEKTAKQLLSVLPIPTSPIKISKGE